MSRAFPEIIPLDVGTFTFAADEPYAGEQGVVVAYAIRRREGVLLFDTGFGFGNAELDARYHPVGPLMRAVLGEAGVRIGQVDLIANCHLHPDHAGQNVSFPGIPIHVQAAELAAARAGGHTILEWIDGPGVTYVEAGGDHDLLPGIRVLSTPGHSAGHQSLVVDQPSGPVVLTGQAIYGLDEWAGTPGREGRGRAPFPEAYDLSVAKLRAVEPVGAWFAHDRRRWSANRE